MLIDREHRVLAGGSHTWENRLRNGIWTYSMEQILGGLQACYADMKRSFEERYGEPLSTVGALGVSAMMHGYLPLDNNGEPLTEFRSWRNTITGEASALLTKEFSFHIPQRWTIAHLYQAILNGEEHVGRIGSLMTLAVYIHWRLSGERAAGLGEASGIVPLDRDTPDYDQGMIDRFEELIADRRYPWKLRDLLPRAVPAGQPAGRLTEEGALLLDPTGTLRPGVPLAPCEGDADTGLVATNSVRPRTGSVSAGTSAFSVLVADRPLGVHREVDMFCTPTGKPAAMVHSSNCTSELNAWVGLFAEFAEAVGAPQDTGRLYTLLFRKALEGEADAGGLLACNYVSGEGVTDFVEGRPLFVRMPDARLDLGNFMRTQLMSALTTMKIGLDLLMVEENVRIDRLYAHGGYFKTPEVGLRILSAATGTPVSALETAGEGGPFGMALLCAYLLWHGPGESLEDYLDGRVFADVPAVTVRASPEEIRGFADYAARYRRLLEVERAAVLRLPADPPPKDG